VNIQKTLQFDLKIQNRALVGSDITSVAPGSRNYDVDFYFSFANLESTLLGSTTTYKLTNTVEPTGSLHIGLTGTSISDLMSYTSTVTLPNANCNNYVWLCGCVKKGPDATYIDEDTTDNCKCKDSTSLISCFPGKLCICKKCLCGKVYLTVHFSKGKCTSLGYKLYFIGL
jgi:hypothetical protein